MTICFSQFSGGHFPSISHDFHKDFREFLGKPPDLTRKKFKTGSSWPYFGMRFTPRPRPGSHRPTASYRGRCSPAPGKLFGRPRAKTRHEQPVDSDFRFGARPAAARDLFFIFFVSKTAAIQKSAVLKTDFFEDARPEIHPKRRATDTSETWGVEKRLKFKKAPFPTHPTFFDFSRRNTSEQARGWFSKSPPAAFDSLAQEETTTLSGPLKWSTENEIL